MRKKIIAVFTVVLVACVATVLVFGGAAANSENTVPTDNTATEDTGDTPSITQETAATSLTEEAAMELYRQAREIWNWFELGRIPTGDVELRFLPDRVKTDNHIKV